MLVKEFPEDSICQKIAAEMNLSETAFVKHLDSNRFHIRWFTPGAEVKLCGHATLASAHIICCERLVTGDKIVFESLSGELTVHSSSSSNYSLEFPLSTVERNLNVDYLKSIFGDTIRAAVQIDDDIVIEMLDEKSVKEYAPKFEDLVKLDCRGIAVTARATGSYDFVSRFFAPRLGVNEDPVTGSAHCKLAYYWQKLLNKSRFVAYQASSRGGEIGITIVDDRVHLSGKAVLIFTGNLHVSLG